MPAQESARKTMSPPPLGRFYTVGGRQLMLHRSGRGSPAIVFLAGAGAVGLDYLNIQAPTAELTTSILYDRAGTGWSEAVSLPRTSRQVTDELRELLAIAGVPQRYILVGHSLGGLYARHYAQRFPDEVAALLLLDPAHEDYDAYMPKQLKEMRTGRALGGEKSRRTALWIISAKKHLYSVLGAAVAHATRSAFVRRVFARLPAIRRYRDLYRQLFAEEMKDWPEEIRNPLIEAHISLEWLSVGLQEAQNVDQLYDEVRSAGPMPDVPLIVLCSTGVDGFRRAVSVGESDSQLRDEIEGKQRLYENLARTVRRGEVRLVDGGHFTMHFSSPDAVLQAIKDLATAPRDQRTMPIAAP
jgi:pimeloyl-ACP methyl ester carboxylesterase